MTTAQDLNAPNDFGVPLCACHGWRHDEHYWAYVRAVLVPAMLARARGLS